MIQSDTPNMIVPCELNNFSADKGLTLVPHINDKWTTFCLDSAQFSETLNIEFENNNQHKNIEKEQVAKLIITFDSTVAADWQFYGNGVEYCGADSNCQYNVSTEITNDNTLVLKITQVVPTYEFKGVNKNNLDEVIEVTEGTDTKYLPISFRYTAKHLPSGKIYMSQDPKIAVRRPR